MGDEDDEEESDAIVTQVLDELGLQLTDQLTAVPTAGSTIAAPGGAKKTAVAAGEVIIHQLFRKGEAKRTMSLMFFAFVL
jgi:hypothetical protein